MGSHQMNSHFNSLVAVDHSYHISATPCATVVSNSQALESYRKNERKWQGCQQSWGGQKENNGFVFKMQQKLTYPCPAPALREWVSHRKEFTQLKHSTLPYVAYSEWKMETEEQRLLAEVILHGQC